MKNTNYLNALYQKSKHQKAVKQHILIVGPSWLGDMVMAQALFIALKQLNPKVLIDVLAPAWSLPILARMPEVRRSFVLTVGHGHLGLKERYKISRSLRHEQYHQAILLPNAFKSALIPIFAKIPRRTGWRGEMRYGLLNDIRVLDKKRYPLMVERFVALAYPSGQRLPLPLPRPALLINNENRLLVQTKFNVGHKPMLALCPGAEFGEAKRWPETYYAEVATVYINKGFQVCLFGSANDQIVTKTILAAIDLPQREACLDLAGLTSMAEVVDLLSIAELVVSNDSGLMHIAAALQRPMAVVYGSTSADFTPPLSDRVAVLFEPVECGPCFARVCPRQDRKCLVDLTPGRVLQALVRLEADSTSTLEKNK